MSTTWLHVQSFSEDADARPFARPPGRGRVRGEPEGRPEPEPGGDPRTPRKRQAGGAGGTPEWPPGALPGDPDAPATGRGRTFPEAVMRGRLTASNADLLRRVRAMQRLIDGAVVPGT